MKAILDPIGDQKQAERIVRLEKALDALIDVCDSGDAFQVYSRAIAQLRDQLSAMQS